MQLPLVLDPSFILRMGLGWYSVGDGGGSSTFGEV
jgi:hypothetical protein